MSTVGHDAFIERYLPSKGPAWVAERIGTTPGNVSAWGRRRGVSVGDVRGYRLLTEVAAEAQTLFSNAWTIAQREGVLVRVGAKSNRRASRCLVPDAWAREFIAMHQTKVANADLREAGWLMTNEVMRSLKVGRGTVIRAATGTGVLGGLFTELGVSVAKARAIGKGGTLLLFEPRGVDRVRSRLEADRRKAKTMVSTKSLSVEFSVAQSTAADMGKRMGGELLFVHGRLMCHVTPEVAEAMRERFRGRK